MKKAVAVENAPTTALGRQTKFGSGGPSQMIPGITLNTFGATKYKFKGMESSAENIVKMAAVRRRKNVSNRAMMKRRKLMSYRFSMGPVIAPPLASVPEKTKT